MDRRDKIWLRALTIAFALFVLGLAYFGWQLGHSLERQDNNMQQQIDINRELDNKQQTQLETQQKQLEYLRTQIKDATDKKAKDGEDGKPGAAGANGKPGKDGITRVENHETQTVIEKQVQPLPGINGKTPQFAIDGQNHQLLMRYEGDEEWQLVPVLCQSLSLVCSAR